MTRSNPTLRLSESELAYNLLLANGRPMNYKELVEHVLDRLGMPIDAVQMAAVLTQINLDSRFAYIGQGEWGLKVWMPARGSRRLPTITLMNKALAYDDEDKGIDLDKERDLDEMDADLEDEGIQEDQLEEEESDDENWDG